MRKAATLLLVLFVLAAAAGWWVSAPRGLPAGATEALQGDAGRGEAVFLAAGCAGCHAAPGATGEARLVLAGGRRFVSPFGTFVAPNISPHPEAGIGGWTFAQFADAVQAGVSPDGRHYYPAFPYTAYANATLQDIADLWAYLGTLPPDATPSAPHDVGFPFSIRRGIGVWKALYAGQGWAVPGDLPPPADRGRYLAEALAHCGECHTGRDALGGPVRDRWLAGGPNPSGEGRIPGITPAQLAWSEAEIAAYLSTGFTPDFDVVGGHMAEVVESLSGLPREELLAIAAYLKAVRAVE